jgi:CRISPR-associated exonuclease Cas4
MNEAIITGTMVNYYHHCKRQVWYFAKHITMEHGSDMVFQGKLLNDTSYDREKKEIDIEHVKLDFFNIHDGVLHEIKKSSSFSHAHKWQVLYYLFFLKSRGIWPIEAEINYPKEKRVDKVQLSSEYESKINEILVDIQNLLAANQPPCSDCKIAVCKKCSYFDFCYI